MSDKYNPAMGFIPMLRKPQIPVPNYKDLNENTWTHRLYSAPNSTDYILGPTMQSDNFRSETDVYQNSGIKMYGMPTGKEPLYGRQNTDMNQYINNNGVLNKPLLDIQDQTRILDNKSMKYRYSDISTYPASDFLISFVGGGELLK